MNTTGTPPSANAVDTASETRVRIITGAVTGGLFCLVFLVLLALLLMCNRHRHRRRRLYDRGTECDQECTRKDSYDNLGSDSLDLSVRPTRTRLGFGSFLLLFRGPAGGSYSQTEFSQVAKVSSHEDWYPVSLAKVTTEGKHNLPPPTPPPVPPAPRRLPNGLSEPGAPGYLHQQRIPPTRPRPKPSMSARGRVLAPLHEDFDEDFEAAIDSPHAAMAECGAIPAVTRRVWTPLPDESPPTTPSVDTSTHSLFSSSGPVTPTSTSMCHSLPSSTPSPTPTFGRGTSAVPKVEVKPPSDSWPPTAPAVPAKEAKYSQRLRRLPPIPSSNTRTYQPVTAPEAITLTEHSPLTDSRTSSETSLKTQPQVLWRTQAMITAQHKASVSSEHDWAPLLHDNPSQPATPSLVTASSQRPKLLIDTSVGGPPAGRSRTRKGLWQ